MVRFVVFIFELDILVVCKFVLRMLELVIFELSKLTVVILLSDVFAVTIKLLVDIDCSEAYEELVYIEDTDIDVIDGAVKFVTLRFDRIPDEEVKFVNRILVVVILVDLI